jgi:hypothetical protein
MRRSRSLASNSPTGFARDNSRLAVDVGAAVGRGRRNGRWRSHRRGTRSTKGTTRTTEIPAMRLNHFPKSLPDFLLQQWFTLNARDRRDPQGFPITTLDRCRPAARIPRHDRDDIEIVGICACRGSAPSRSSIQTAGFRHRDTENAVSRRATESVKHFFSFTSPSSI